MKATITDPKKVPKETTDEIKVLETFKAQLDKMTLVHWEKEPAKDVEAKN